ncbi:hypothetical protein BDR06DRAFT_1013483 [Suillus hirtellus]|nr:hypothetical protein BDR06DRAFT_1013483 [Suillus hirtellus]
MSSSSEDTESLENEFAALRILLNEINISIPPDKEMCFPEQEEWCRRWNNFMPTFTACTEAGKNKGLDLKLSEEEVAKGLQCKLAADNFMDKMKIVKEAAALQAVKKGKSKAYDTQDNGPEIEEQGRVEVGAEVDDVPIPLSRARRAKKSVLPVSSDSEVEIVEVRKVSKLDPSAEEGSVMISPRPSSGSRITQDQMKLESRSRPYVLVPSLKRGPIQLDDDESLEDNEYVKARVREMIGAVHPSIRLDTYSLLSRSLGPTPHDPMDYVFTPNALESMPEFLERLPTPSLISE